MMGVVFGHPIWVALLFLPVVFAQVTSYPSNSSEDTVGNGSSRYMLVTTQFTPSPVPLLPLTQALVHPQSRTILFNVTGTLVNVEPENANQLSDSDIAYVSCDESAYVGNLQVRDTIEAIISRTPTASAILLYTTEYDHCNYSTELSTPAYSNVFSVAGPVAARGIREGLGSRQSIDVQTSSIVADSSLLMLADQSGADSLTGLPNSQSQQGESGPTSSIAMIVLYSVTGLITALFLSVIITGAIRAHRHPERYGPRNIAGRPRQSRAKGIARAMLETLPVVKFGDLDDTRRGSQKADVEMTSHDEPDEEASGGIRQSEVATEQTNRQAADTVVNAGDTQGEATERVSREQDSGQIGPADSGRGRTPSPQETPGVGTLGCSICTDNFVKGQDVRLLPCNHKFHPECVDPWLVNVSGTCPLCRIDLHPPSAEGADRPGTADGQDLPPPLRERSDAETTGEARNTHRGGHRRLTQYIHDTIDAMPLRESTVEQRMDTVRQLRNAQPAGAPATSTGAVEATEETDRHSRLPARLRDRFRIRTRRHGEDST